ncbi:hypothetical protein Bbelb_384910 [Branchiostoma belcheri]|nr:hypothetical protein Bbelb_384910 [Branchiostoma belcheri]
MSKNPLLKNITDFLSFAMFTMSKNPLLKNITDFLVEETSAEEDELLGTGEEGEEKGSEVTPEVTLDRDEERLKVLDQLLLYLLDVLDRLLLYLLDVLDRLLLYLLDVLDRLLLYLLDVLDRLLLYLRIVHSIDYYTATEYPNEDEMPNRCGIMHGRGPVPTGRPVTQNDDNLSEEEAVKLGKKDPEVYPFVEFLTEVEKFVKANTQEISKDKWLCPISGKKFKGPEFVRKHIFNKHAEKVESVKKECVFFNNYILDPKRPQIPEPQTTKPPPLMGPGGGRGEGYPPMYQGPPGGFMYGQPRPPMYEGQNICLRSEFIIRSASGKSSSSGQPQVRVHYQVCPRSEFTIRSAPGQSSSSGLPQVRGSCHRMDEAALTATGAAAATDTNPGDGGYNPHTHPHTNPHTHPHTNPHTHPHTNPHTHPHTNPHTHPHTNPHTHPHTNPHTHPHTNPGDGGGRSDPRSIIEYRDLDAPDDMDYF